MNERIRELAEQAEEWNADGDKCEVNLQKFAQLIIRECRDIVGKVRDTAIEDEWNIEEAMSTAMYDIDEHFGVEE